MTFNLAHYNGHLIRSASVLTAACLLGLTPMMASEPAYAITTSHASTGGHVSATHTTAPVTHMTTPAARPMTSMTARPTTTTTRSTASTGAARTAPAATSPTRSNTAPISRPSGSQIARSVAANRTPSESHVIQSAAHTDTYHDLTTTSQRYSYLDWYGAYSGAYHSPINYLTNIGYFWMPGNIWNTAMTNSTHDRLSQAMINQAKARHYYWITVGRTKVAVPQDIYDKIQIGDLVKLIDGHHIQINGHMYKQ